MNPEPNGKIVWHFGVNFIAACLLFVAFTILLRLCMEVPAIDAERSAVIAKALADLHTAEAAALNHPGWIDQDRKIVRLPIQTALQLSENAAQNPAAARASLIARAEKAAAPLPKVAPKPSAFE